MKFSLLFLSTLLLQTSFAASVDVRVKTGLAPGKDPLVSVATDLQGSLTVVDAAGKRVPCAVRLDPSGRRFVAWRVVGADILEILDYRIVETEGTQEDLTDVPDVLPGMNLIANADFSRRDAAGDIVDWSPSPEGFGIKGRWTGKDRDEIRTKNGMLGLRGECPCVVTYVHGLQSGHVYRLSYDGLCREGRLALSVWFQGANGNLPNDPIKGVGNYKLITGVTASSAWETVEDSSFVYEDMKTKRMNFNCRGLLPGTGSAYLSLYVKKGAGCIRNLRFEDVTIDSGVRAEIIR